MMAATAETGSSRKKKKKKGQQPHHHVVHRPIRGEEERWETTGLTSVPRVTAAAATTTAVAPRRCQ